MFFSCDLDTIVFFIINIRWENRAREGMDEVNDTPLSITTKMFLSFADHLDIFQLSTHLSVFLQYVCLFFRPIDERSSMYQCPHIRYEKLP